MALGSAFQKVNFLRDLKDDFQGLESYLFSQVLILINLMKSKSAIIKEIESDFAHAMKEFLNFQLKRVLEFILPINITVTY